MFLFVQKDNNKAHYDYQTYDNNPTNHDNNTKTNNDQTNNTKNNDNNKETNDIKSTNFLLSHWNQQRRTVQRTLQLRIPGRVDLSS